MSSKLFFQTVENKAFHCVQFGNGGKLLIAFHGFGDDASSFEVLKPSLGNRFTVVAVDLPFHGKTNWPTGEKFTPAQAHALVTSLMQQHNVQTVSLAAFSIGGKIALKIYETMPEKVDALWLFAPDGLKTNVWYNLAVYPAFGRRLFRFLLDNSNILVALVTLLQTIRVFPKSFSRFLKHNLNSAVSRERIWNTWLGIAGFELSPRLLRETLMKHATPCFIFMGQHDPVIKPRIGKRFVNGIASARLIILPKGHYLLKPYLNEHINKLLAAGF